MHTFMLWAGLASAAPQAYTVDAGRSLLYINVYKDASTLAAGMSHDHAIRASGWVGRVWVDPDALGQCDVRISVPVSGLVIDEPWLRERSGLEGVLSESVRASVAKNMRSAAQLDAASYPTIQFTASSCSPDEIAGELTIRSVTQHVTMPAEVVADGSTFSLDGQLTIRATSFGFEPFSAMMGALRNRDDMTLRVRLVSVAPGDAQAAAPAE